jgi:hypothetical protein
MRPIGGYSGFIHKFLMMASELWESLWESWWNELRWGPWTHGSTILLCLVLRTGPGNPPAFRFLAGGLVSFGPSAGQKPNLHCLGGFVTQAEPRTVGFWPGSNQTAVPDWRFAHHGLQLSIWVLIVSWHGEYVNCAIQCALSPPGFRFAIWPILIQSLWNNAQFQGKFRGIRSRLSEYWSNCNSERVKWKST